MNSKLIIRVLLCSTFIAGSGAILQSCIFDPGARTLFPSEEPVARSATPTRRTTPTVKKVAAQSTQPAFTRSENSSSGNSGGGGMGGGSSSSSSSSGGWSDRRLKIDIRRLGTSAEGIPVYAFRYIWGGPLFVGTMAQDLLAIRPEAVIETALGYYMVDYDKLDIAMISLPDDASGLTAEAAMALATRAARVRSRGSVQPVM
ncbi:tail fiber domain-containing protein (plasmid) [Rhizobium leguminosarum]|uniref:tail fiber domain-containing protein n=1 Tax=Rhizobium leguminosarum TaxID=384 RepID=UPI00197F96EE|nr:tail fiber domain-containing protein [Rhizobium leguminosarum]QSZ11761.1 tail fiber domain-containing protein [Rhizobium leguminosarum]